VSDAKPEIWFYHLERSTLEQVLPTLLERTLQRGWRALIRGATSHRLDDIDELLWTDGDHAARQPVLLSESGENLNGAQALFIVDDSELGAMQEFARCFIIFDGRDEQALNHARGRWRTLKADGADLAYWKQSDEGRWEKAA